MKEINIIIVENESIIEAQHIDIILMDIYIKGTLDSIKTAEIIKKRHPKTEIIFLTAYWVSFNNSDTLRRFTKNYKRYRQRPYHCL